MNFLRVLPIIMSGLLLGAHFLRAGNILLVALSLLFPTLLLIRRAWVARLTQLILVLGAIEWVRTLLVLVDERRTAGQPWLRLVLIIGGVAALTASSALLFNCRSLRRRYKLDTVPVEQDNDT